MKSKLNFNDTNGWNRIQSLAVITVKETESDAALRRRRCCCRACDVDTWLGPHLGLGTTLGQKCMNYSNGVGVRSAPSRRDYCEQPFWAQLKDLEGSPRASRSSTPLGGWFIFFPLEIETKNFNKWSFLSLWVNALSHASWTRKKCWTEK